MAKALCFWLADLILPGLLLALGRRRVRGRCINFCTGAAPGQAAGQYFAALCRWFGCFLVILNTLDRLLSQWAGLMDPVHLSVLNTAVGAALCLAVLPLVKLFLAGHGEGQENACPAQEAAPCRPRPGDEHAA